MAPPSAPMPAYTFEFETPQGPARRRFTLDADRPLREQLVFVLAELDRERLVLRGTAGDELAAYWEGRALDPDATPAALGLDPVRPLALRMERRRPTVPVAPVPERPPVRFVPRSVYAGGCWGLAGGIVGWAGGVAAAWWASRAGAPAWSAAPAALDLAAAGAWGGAVGGAVAWGDARRTDRPAARAVAGGAAVGLVAAALVALAVHAVLAREALPAALARLVLWALAATALAGALLQTSRAARGGVAIADRTGGALLGGLAAGVVAGVVAALPGDPALWQALAPALAGAGVGVAVALAAARRITTLLELETLDDHAPGVAGLREWPLWDGATARVRDVARGGEPGAVSIVGGDGRARVAGGAGESARELRADDRLRVGRSTYRLRRRLA